MNLTSEFIRDMRECYTQQGLTSNIEKATLKAQGYMNQGKTVRAEYEIGKAFSSLQMLTTLYEIEQKDLQTLRAPLIEIDTQLAKWLDEDLLN